jgi:nucleoside diphosphate kinase
MKNESCFIIKPDKERRHLIAEDAMRIAMELGLKPYLMGEKKLSLDEAIAFYKDFKDELWFSDFVEYLMSGEIKAYFTEGDGAIEKTIEVKRRVREKYAIDRQKNAIHVPKKEKSVQETRELIRRIFS